MKDKAKWRFMVYLAGDNNLSDAFLIELQDIQIYGPFKP